MENLKNRLDILSKKFNDDDFLSNKGLSNEVGIHIFCYDPKEQKTVDNYVSQIKKIQTKANIIEFDLYEVFLKICEDKRVLDRLAKTEEQKGETEFLKLVNRFATPKAFIDHMTYENHSDTDVLLLTGIGKVYPYMRCNNILENIQPEFPNIPVVVMYPGSYTGQTLVLFDRFETNYYRAFNLL